ncbi:MAG: radical SAM protein [Chitinivibrionales bacterium]|nr:radical SAM protein [Chitinivibrionales bacterium]MBD3357224.1 radical SAM protein [Chitinivibrionales bacterium]
MKTNRDRNKRVVFVEPSNTSQNIFAKYMHIPLLGPVYLATIAENAGYEVEVLNENILGRSVSKQELSSADILCITSLTSTITRGKELGREYREARAESGLPSRSIVGGIHASMLPEDVQVDFDQVAVGEGENILLDLLDGKLTDKIVYGTPLEDLDSLPIPDYSLVKGWDRRTKRVWPVMTSRGCPFDCDFCSVTEMFGRGYRAQSPERVMAELENFRDRRGFVFIVDDNFAVNMKRSEKILDLMLDKNFDRPWSTQLRTDATRNPELINKMKRAGCYNVYIGFESVNPESLERMKKSQSVADIRRAMTVFHGNDIKVHGMFILGNDPDTTDVFKMTSQFCRDINLDFAQYSILTPLPGTAFYRRILDEGRLLHTKWEFFDGMHTVFKPKNMTPDQLQRGMIECFGDFYSYGNATIEALNTVLATGTALVRRIFTETRLPSFRAPAIKLAAPGVVRKWIQENRSYLNYLKKT